MASIKSGRKGPPLERDCGSGKGGKSAYTKTERNRGPVNHQGPFRFPSHFRNNSPVAHTAPVSTSRKISTPIKPSGPAAISSVYSTEELLNALKAIQNLVQCSLCHKQLSSIRTCASGHGFCYNCKTRCSNVCPLCNSLVMNNKPVLLNSIVKLLPRKCKYLDKGCDILVLASDKDHETFCRFRETCCRMPNCGKKCMAKDLLRHLEDFHGKEMVRTATYRSILMNFDASIEKHGLMVIVAYNNIFWQHMRVGNNRILQFYQYIPMDKPKLSFSAMVTFYTPEESFSAITPVHTDVFDPLQLFDDKETFCLPPETAESFNHYYSGVNYDFQIMKKDV